MSDDEIFLLVISGIVSLICGGAWLYRIQAIGAVFNSPNRKLPLATTPAVCALLLFTVLNLFASHDVRDAPEYLLLYQAMGAGWVGFFALILFPWLGVHYVDDAVERSNSAAAVAICGAL